MVAAGLSVTLPPSPVFQGPYRGSLLPPPLGAVGRGVQSLRGGRLLQGPVALRLVLQPGVTLALAGRHHRDAVSPGAAVLALQADPLGAGAVDDAAPLLGLSAAPVAAGVAAADPVGQQVGGEAFPRAHQLLHGVKAGALAVRDVLGGAQLPAAHLVLLQT